MLVYGTQQTEISLAVYYFKQPIQILLLQQILLQSYSNFKNILFFFAHLLFVLKKRLNTAILLCIIFYSLALLRRTRHMLI